MLVGGRGQPVQPGHSGQAAGGSRLSCSCSRRPSSVQTRPSPPALTSQRKSDNRERPSRDSVPRCFRAVDQHRGGATRRTKGRHRSRYRHGEAAWRPLQPCRAWLSDRPGDPPGDDFALLRWWRPATMPSSCTRSARSRPSKCCSDPSRRSRTFAGSLSSAAVWQDVLFFTSPVVSGGRERGEPHGCRNWLRGARLGPTQWRPGMPGLSASPPT